MKTVYLYDIVNKKSNAVVATAPTRQEARDVKNYYKGFGNSISIVQKKYVLAEQKVVR